MRTVYRERYDTIAAGLRRDLGHELELLPAAAGVHLSALARKRSAAEMALVARRAVQRGVAVWDLARFAVGADQRSGLVLGFGAIATKDIDEELRRLAASFEQS
jgi:GntR family transcriptional regulator/MocR family aminotransferase